MKVLRVLLGIAFVFALAGSPSHAQRLASPEAAAELVSLMTQQGLDAFAVQDAQAPHQFFAVLMIPNVQLLVVSAEYPSPAELTAQLTHRNYRDVYRALHQPASAPTRFFLLDLGCDGLIGKSKAVDVLYEKGVTQTLFNGSWEPQGLSEDGYQMKVKEAEARYSHILSRLVEALRASTDI